MIVSNNAVAKDSSATYDSIPPLTLVKEVELLGPEVQRPWAAAIWGSRLAIIPDDGPDEDQVLLFDLKTGSFLGQLGRRGSGPGEFGRVRVVRALASGELFTVDVANARVAWWTPSQRKPRKEESIVGVDWFDAVPWLGDTLLFTARYLPQDAAGYPLHLSINRHIAASFGTDRPHLEVGNWTEFIRRLLASSTLKAIVVTISTDGRIVTYDEDANDEPVITVWRAQVPYDRAKGGKGPRIP